MKRIFLQFNFNQKRKNNSGFVLLFTLVLVVIILAISLGVSNITFRELAFSTSTKETNEAFYAADTGVECALYYDFNPVPIPNTNPVEYVYVFSDEAMELGIDTIDCVGSVIQVEFIKGRWWFTFGNSQGSSQNEFCATVTVMRDVSTGKTSIESRGYNTGDDTNFCDSNNPNQIERVLEVSY